MPETHSYASLASAFSHAKEITDSLKGQPDEGPDDADGLIFWPLDHFMSDEAVKMAAIIAGIAPLAEVVDLDGKECFFLPFVHGRASLRERTALAAAEALNSHRVNSSFYFPPQNGDPYYPVSPGWARRPANLFNFRNPVVPVKEHPWQEALNLLVALEQKLPDWWPNDYPEKLAPDDFIKREQASRERVSSLLNHFVSTGTVGEMNPWDVWFARRRFQYAGQALRYHIMWRHQPLSAAADCVTAELIGEWEKWRGGGTWADASLLEVYSLKV